MMRALAISLSHPVRCLPRRAVLVWLLVFAQFAAAIGFPSVTPRGSGKDASRAFPCMNRPCGCGSYDECWAGDCCCFSLAEKIAWARQNDITPPAAAVEKAARSAAKTKPKSICPLCADEGESIEGGSCCSKPKDSPKHDSEAMHWTLGVYARKCHGQEFASSSLSPVAVAPQIPGRVAITRPVVSRDRLIDCRATARFTEPAIPPPRI